jgi:uncharacterized membrane protein
MVAIMFALVLTVLLGFAGLALDGARLYVYKSELQNAADACALAAAQDLAPGGGMPDFTRARDAAVLMVTRNRGDFQSQALPASSVTVEFAANATGAAAWRQPGAAQAGDLVARCTLAPAALALWLMPVMGIASAEVTAKAAATRNVAGNGCAPGAGSCQAIASLLQ